MIPSSAFLVLSLAVIVAPGPDTLSILGLGLSRGKAAAIQFGFGCALGCVTHTLWAALGVTAAIAASALAFTVLKLLGAAYLVYLGIVVLRAGAKSPVPRGSIGEGRRFLLRGFIANATNPKVALFFLAFLPQFVDRSRGATLQMIAMGACFGLMTALVFAVLGNFSGRIGHWLRARPEVNRWSDRVTGILFLGLGVRLVFAHR